MNRAAAMAPMDAAAARGVLALQHCLACERMQYPPREVCSHCLSGDLAWRESAAESGAILAVTTLRHSHEPVFRDRLPLHIGLVRLDGGASVICFISPEAAAGARVVLRAKVDSLGRAIVTAEDAP